MLDICLLGTGGMMPLPYRWLTSLMTRYNGSSLLIDCGEGTQIAIKEKGWSFKPIDTICFTHYHGKKVNIHSPKDAIKAGLALVTEDRKNSGLNLVGTIASNITMVSIADLSKNSIVNDGKIRKVSDEYIDKMKIKTPSRDQVVGNLSGGNQQKVVIAKWLLSNPEIIFLDEPTRGIDVGAKRDIYLLIGELVKSGKAVIVVSSEIPELMGICDRIMMLNSEIATAIQENAKITVIVFDNTAFGCINNLQMGNGVGSLATEMRHRDEKTGKLDGKYCYTDFARIGEGYGMNSAAKATGSIFCQTTPKIFSANTRAAPLL